MKPDLKMEHYYDAPVSTINSHGFCGRNYNAVRVMEVIHLLARTYLPPSADITIRSSVSAHG